MSACEEAPRWWHGGFGGLGIGEFVLPPSESGARSLADAFAECKPVLMRNRVYVTSNRTAALLFAAMHPSLAGSVYEVEPIGELEPDADCLDDALSKQCAKARVLSVHRVTRRERIMVFQAMGVSR